MSLIVRVFECWCVHSTFDRTQLLIISYAVRVTLGTNAAAAIVNRGRTTPHSARTEMTDDRTTGLPVTPAIELHVTPAVASALRLESTWADPPPDLWAEIERVVAVPHWSDVRTRELTSGGTRTQPRRRRFMPLAAAAVAVVVALAVVSGYMWGSAAQHDDPTHSIAFALRGTELQPESRARGTVRFTPSGLEITLDIAGLPPAPPNAYYQGWLKSDVGVVTIGTFHARDHAEDIVLWSGVDDVSTYKTLTVTIQHEGRGPASSGLVVLTGPVNP